MSHMEKWSSVLHAAMSGCGCNLEVAAETFRLGVGEGASPGFSMFICVEFVTGDGSLILPDLW